MEEDKDYINLIHGDLTRATQIQNGLPDSIGVMSIKTANWTILEASLLPTPRALWNSFGYEGELSCVFADSNVGKSILAVQIADRIARTDNVLYLDLELSEKQFQLRYTGEHGKLYTFPDRLYRVSLDSNSLLEDNFEEAIIGGMEQMALQTGCENLHCGQSYLPVLRHGERRCGGTADDTTQQPQKEIRAVHPCSGAYPCIIYYIFHF